MFSSSRYLIPVLISAIVSVECDLALTNSTASAADVTFTTEIAKIMFDHCSACHRPGQAGPFSLLTFEDFRKHSETIRLVTESRYMPPWKPVHAGIEFANDRRLSDDEISYRCLPKTTAIDV